MRLLDTKLAVDAITLFHTTYLTSAMKRKKENFIADYNPVEGLRLFKAKCTQLTHILLPAWKDLTDDEQDFVDQFDNWESFCYQFFYRWMVQDPSLEAVGNETDAEEEKMKKFASNLIESWRQELINDAAA